MASNRVGTNTERFMSGMLEMSEGYGQRAGVSRFGYAKVCREHEGPDAEQPDIPAGRARLWRKASADVLLRSQQARFKRARGSGADRWPAGEPWRARRRALSGAGILSAGNNR